MEKLRNFFRKYIIKNLDSKKNIKTIKNEKVFEIINKEFVLNDLSKLYIKNLLILCKESLEKQNKEEMEKHDLYKELKDKKNQTYIILLENLQILQKNIEIINRLIIEYDVDENQSVNNLKKSLSLREITKINLLINESAKT